MYPCKYDIDEEENVQHEHTKNRCDYFTGPKKRKIGTALSRKKISFIVDCCED